MKNLPLLGQFLGRAFWIPCITADGEGIICTVLFQCQIDFIVENLSQRLICCVLIVLAGSRALLFQCLWGMYSESPKNAVEEKANKWIRVCIG